MGITKNITLDSGVVVGYHEIIAFSINKSLGADIVVYSYISEALKNQGKDEVDQKEFKIPSGTFTNTTIGSFELIDICYSLLATNAYFL